ncbi:MAG: hypothetical protein ABI120_16650 [Gemmatimonadaceae bacterium]
MYCTQTKFSELYLVDRVAARKELSQLAFIAGQYAQEIVAGDAVDWSSWRAKILD